MFAWGAHAARGSMGSLDRLPAAQHPGTHPVVVLQALALGLLPGRPLRLLVCLPLGAVQRRGGRLRRRPPLQ